MTDMLKHGLSRRTLIKGTASAAALSLLASPRIVRADEGTIKIGFPVPITGPFGAEAKDQVKSAELAIKQFNAEGGLGGRMAELLVRDDKLNPGEAATRTLELIEKDKANFIVGSLSSAVQLSVNEVTRARGVIYVSISQSDTINEAKDFSRFTFHEAMNPQMTAGAVARYAFKKGQKVAYLTADYAYGHEMVAAFKRTAPAGVETVGEVLHPLGAPDYSAFMPRLLSMKADVLCICNFGRDQANAIKQAVDFGLKAQSRIVVPVLLYKQRLASSPDVFEGVVGAANYYWGIEDTTPSAKAFNDAYRAANGGAVPTDYGAYGYTGIRSLLMAVKAAGSTDTDKVIAAMENLKYDVAKGPQSYRKCDHQSVQQVFVLESKKKSEMKNADDLFKVVNTEPADPATLRSCEELGHKPS
ncbi:MULTISPECIES: ABC transporter substrate-binding protein [Rhodopseudomonas]|uniref:ABC transporter substrate-binding protein n=2 Tax=Rhodopseudomonas TaxID=1073 RepID=A0A0D7EJQ9_RHOPL|nr:ABC transporter substrate-binding protein [Rhodopseudomonas palustris]